MKLANRRREYLQSLLNDVHALTVEQAWELFYHIDALEKEIETLNDPKHVLKCGECECVYHIISVTGKCCLTNITVLLDEDCRLDDCIKERDKINAKAVENEPV